MISVQQEYNIISKYILQINSTFVSLYSFPSIVNNYCTSLNLFKAIFFRKASLARFNQSVYVSGKKKIADHGIYRKQK